MLVVLTKIATNLSSLASCYTRKPLGTLLLIRHGQASFLADDYDVLSDLGAEQSRALGGYLARDLLNVDAVYRGPRQRHRDTARFMLDGARAAGSQLPEPVAMDELDEYPFEDLVKHHLPTLIERHPELAELMPSGQAGEQRKQVFGTLLGELSTRWAHDRLDVSGLVETYGEFCDRVVRGAKRAIDEQGRGKTVALVTSGGPVTVFMREVLGLGHDDRTWNQAWLVRNTSISEYKYRSNEISMLSWNGIPHLTEQSLVTYR